MTPAARTACLFTAGLVIWLTGCLEPGIDASVAPAAGDEAAAQQAVHYDDGDVDEGKRTEQARQAARDGCGAGCCDSGGCGAVEGQGSSCGGRR